MNLKEVELPWSRLLFFTRTDTARPRVGYRRVLLQPGACVCVCPTALPSGCLFAVPRVLRAVD